MGIALLFFFSILLIIISDSFFARENSNHDVLGYWADGALLDIYDGVVGKVYIDRAR